MRTVILLFFFTLNGIGLYAHTVRGRIEGLKEGEIIRLYTNREGVVEHKWSLGQAVDSATVAGGTFEFRLPDPEYGRLWLLRAGKRNLKFYFNRNEDLFIEGIYSGRQLWDARVSGSRDATLCDDIFRLLDRNALNPIDRREGVEWLKRHAAEDITAFATAYFYMQKKVLTPTDVEEIMKEIHAPVTALGRKNPYWQLLEQYHRKNSRVQPGCLLPETVLIDREGKKVTGAFRPGQAVLIYNCGIAGFGPAVLSVARELIDLQKKMPGLNVLLVIPDFSEETMAELRRQIAGKAVWIADYTKTSTANPALYYDPQELIKLILVNADRQIVAVNPQLMQCPALLAQPLRTDGFRINGYVLGIDEGIAELVMDEDGTLNTPVIKDTAVIQNGYFTLQGKVSYPRYCNIQIRGTSFPVGCYLDNSIIGINIRLNPGKPLKDGSFTKALSGEVYGSRGHAEYMYLSRLETEQLIGEWIAAHPDSEAVLDCMLAFWVGKYAPEVVEGWLNVMHPALRERPVYQELLRQIAERRRLAVGMDAPDFTLRSAEGEQVGLKSFRGKYVLVDFWASWCGPCRAEIPHLKTLWKQYHDKGLEMISITLDRKDSDWQKALADEQMPWTQLTAKGTKVTEDYNVQGIPHIVLLNPQGKLTAVNLRGLPLEKKLAEIFH